MADRTFARACNVPGPGLDHCTNPRGCLMDVHQDHHSGSSWPKNERQEHQCGDRFCSTNREDGRTVDPDWGRYDDVTS